MPKRLNYRKRTVRLEKPATRAEQAGISFDPGWIDRFTNEDGMWSEAHLNRADAHVRAMCRDVLITWAWSQLRQLPPAQRASVELYYFRGVPLTRAGQLLGRDASTVHRANKRAIESLRALRPRDGRLARFADLYRFGIDRRVLRRLREQARTQY